jgi:hypothetical protein
MTITAAFPNQLKADALAAACPPADVYKMALYTSTATLDKSTTAYSTTNEVVGTGYTAGGVTLSGYTPGAASDTAWIDFADPSWANANITARGALIYNSSKSNKAVAVLDFGSDVTSTASTFTVQLPAPAAATAVVRLG